MTETCTQMTETRAQMTETQHTDDGDGDARTDDGDTAHR